MAEWVDPVSRHHSESTEPVHSWFELSYAQYLTIPRTALQSMPEAWQQRFVECLEELDAAIDWRPKDGQYWVVMRDGNRNRFLSDPLMDYQRGRRKVPVLDVWTPVPVTDPTKVSA